LIQVAVLAKRSQPGIKLSPIQNATRHDFEKAQAVTIEAETIAFWRSLKRIDVLVKTAVGSHFLSIEETNKVQACLSRETKAGQTGTSNRFTFHQGLKRKGGRRIVSRMVFGFTGIGWQRSGMVAADGRTLNHELSACR